MIDRLPPQSTEAEQSVLGSILIDRDAVIEVAEFLKPEDFYRQAHAKVYAVMLDLFERREPIDIVTVSEALERDEDLESIGGERFVLDLCARCGLVWQRFAPGPGILTKLYGSWSEPEQLHERQDTLRHGQSYAQEVMLVLEHFGDPPSAISVLDFGSGSGRWPLMAAAFGCQAFGADLVADQSS